MALAQLVGLACSNGGLRPTPGGRREAGPEVKEDIRSPSGPEAPPPLVADAFNLTDGPNADAVDASPNSGCGSYVPVPVYCCSSLEPLAPLSPDDSCTFAVPVSPPDPSNVAVYLDKTLVPKDRNNGWTYGASTASIVLTGTYCDQVVIDASPGVLQFLCGCPGLAAPPPCIP